MKDTMEDAAERIAKGQGDVEDAERVEAHMRHTERNYDSYMGSNRQIETYMGKPEPVVDLPEEPHIPNRVSCEVASPYFFHGIGKLGVRFNGVERKNDVVEFDKKAGWVRIHARDSQGRPKAERGRWTCVKLRGDVDPFWKG